MNLPQLPRIKTIIAFAILGLFPLYNAIVTAIQTRGISIDLIVLGGVTFLLFLDGVFATSKTNA
jgi:hypothetical protein